MVIKRALIGFFIIFFVLLCLNGFKYGATDSGITTNDGTTTYKYGMYDVYDAQVGQDLQQLTGITVEKIESHQIDFLIFSPVVLFVITQPLSIFALIVDAAILYIIVEVIVFQWLLSNRKKPKNN